MNSHANHTHPNPVDHVIHHSLRRQVERQQPGAEVKRRMLQRASEQTLLNRMLLRLSGAEYVNYPGRSGRPDDSFGWRELALVQVLRPSSSFGALSGLLR